MRRLSTEFVIEMSFPRPAAALMQPTFLPWQGYFALIASVDHFVFLDDFQFVRRSFMHRNRLFLAPDNPSWVSLPVEHGGRGAVNAVRPILDQGFRHKFLVSLRHVYGHARHFDVIFPAVEEWIQKDWRTLADLNIAFIEMVAHRLGLAPTFARSSTLGSEGKRSSRLLSLLDRLGARTYLSARGSYEYMVEDGVFTGADPEVRFQAFEPQSYPQRHAEAFVPYLSVLDALLQVGPDATKALVSAGQKKFVAWADMPTHISQAAHQDAGRLAAAAGEGMTDDQSY